MKLVALAAAIGLAATGSAALAARNVLPIPQSRILPDSHQHKLVKLYSHVPRRHDVP